MWQDFPEGPLDNTPLADDVEDTLFVEPICKCSRCHDLVKQFSPKKNTFAGYSCINPLFTERLSPHQYFLCNRGIWAYLLDHRVWSKFTCFLFLFFSKSKVGGGRILTCMADSLNHNAERLRVDGFSTSKGPSRSLDTAGLPPSVRSRLRALTQRYALRGDELGWDLDLMKDDDHGITFLLHGKAGIGKTYIASK
jgi:hypothetical protein